MTRALLLRSLIAERFGGNQSHFARAIDRTPAQVNQWLTGHRALGDAGVRTIELALGLTPGYFDKPLSYSRRGALMARQIAEPSADDIIAEVVSLLRSTDQTGRIMALGAVRAALAGYARKG